MKPGDVLKESKERCGLNGYVVKTNYWDDFTTAEKLGEDAIRNTYNRVVNECKDNYIFLTDLYIILDMKDRYWFGEWCEKDDRTGVLYDELWEKLDNFARNHLKGEELQYFIRTTD